MCLKANIWKPISPFLLKRIYEKSLTSAKVSIYKINLFSIYYNPILTSWSINLYLIFNLPFSVVFQIIWCNKYIKIGNKSIINSEILKKSIDFDG